MADRKPRRTVTGSTFGNVAYDLDYYGDVVAAPVPQYVPQSAPQAPAAPAKPKTVPGVETHSPARVRVRVREQQAVAPMAIVGFLAALAMAVFLLVGYIQLDQVYADTVTLQSELSTLEDEGAKLEAEYEEVFDQSTLEAAVAANGTLVTPGADQKVYIDLSEPDNVVVYSDSERSTGIAGFFRTVGNLLSEVVEYFR